MSMIRGIIQSVTAAAGKLLTFACSGRTGETIEDREIFQQYGIASRPPSGAECVLLREGNHIIAVATDDRRYRISLQDGDVSVYAKDKALIHLKADGTILVSADGNMTVTADQIRLGGFSDLQRLVDERVLDIVNNHVHAQLGVPPAPGGVPGTLFPIPGLVLTDITRAK